MICRREFHCPGMNLSGFDAIEDCPSPLLNPRTIVFATLSDLLSLAKRNLTSSVDTRNFPYSDGPAAPGNIAMSLTGTQGLSMHPAGSKEARHPPPPSAPMF